MVELSPCHTREVTGKNVVLEGDLRAVSLFCASRCFLLMSCLILKLSHFFYLYRTNAVLPSAVGPENSYLSANVNPSLNK